MNTIANLKIEEGRLVISSGGISGEVDIFLEETSLVKVDVATRGNTTLINKLIATREGRTVRLTERWYWHSDFIHVTAAIEDDDQGQAWSAPLALELTPRATDGLSWWAPWADPQAGRQIDLNTLPPAGEKTPVAPTPAPTAPPWHDPLVPRPWPAREERFWYGAPAWTPNQPRIGFMPMEDGAYVVYPTATLMRTGDALTVSASFEDTLLDLDVGISANGSLVLRHWRQRFGDGRDRHFTWLILPHPASARSALAALRKYYPAYFTPAVPQSREVCGGGAYSTALVAFDPQDMRQKGFGVNWKASFDFPYMGMFLPPLKKDQPWKSWGGWEMSLMGLRDYARQMEEMGFYCLNYFNVTEFGNPLGEPEDLIPAPGSEWQYPGYFLRKNFPHAVLKPYPQEAETYSNQLRSHYRSWENCWVLDPADPDYRSFLLQQAEKHLGAIPESAGLCIDRIDWLRLYNFERDDGLSWVEGQRASFLGLGWRSLIVELAAILHSEGKVVYVNNHVKRIDFMRDVDGIFDEFSYGGPSINATALLCLEKPAIGWMTDGDMFLAAPDQFMQQHLYLGVHPMVPFPGNDHSLRPSPEVDAYYRAYGPLFNALRGRQWQLRDDLASVSGKALVNVFCNGGELMVVIAFATSQDSIELQLSGREGQPLRILRPGKEEVTQFLTSAGNRIPLERGCAIVCRGLNEEE